jgi:hypothetical protein
LNFSLPGTIDIHDPKIGAEIERHIDELNQEEEEDLENFSPSSTSVSEIDNMMPNETTE